MVSFNTIPESETLLAKEQPKTTSMKRLVGGAAIASFVLGVVAATALSATPAVRPAALHKKSLSAGNPSFTAGIACMRDGQTVWTTDDSEGHGGFYSGQYAKELHGWDDVWYDHHGTNAAFDYVETYAYYLENSASTYCDSFALTVTGPEGQGFRAYDSDGHFLGSFDAGEISSADNCASIPNINFGGKENSEGPFALKTSVFLEDGKDSTVQGNRLLLVSIDFEPEEDPSLGGHHCVVDRDITTDGYKVTSGGTLTCDDGSTIEPPAYSCSDGIMQYKGSLRNLVDGQPINIEFKGGSRLEIPLSNLQIDYHLDMTDEKCQQMCAWAAAWPHGDDDGLQIDGMQDCWAEVWSASVDYSGLGPIKLYGEGVIAPDGIWEAQENYGNWGDWQSNHHLEAPRDDHGVQIKDVIQKNEWYMLGGALDILQDANPDALKGFDYAVEVHGITFANMLPRGDSPIAHQKCYLSTDWDTCYGIAMDGRNGALMKNINHVVWAKETDGPNLQAKGSKIDTSFLMAGDDIIHVSAGDFNAYKNVVVSGSAGSVVNLGSYNDGINDPKIHKVNVDGIFVARIIHGADKGNLYGIVGAPTCALNPLDLQATVGGVVVAGLGWDSSGIQIQHVDRMWSFTANRNGGWFCSDASRDYNWQNLTPPKFNVDMPDWTLCEDDGNAGNCPYEDSSICNWVGDESLDSFVINGGGPDDHKCQFKKPY